MLRAMGIDSLIRRTPALLFILWLGLGPMSALAQTPQWAESMLGGEEGGTGDDQPTLDELRAELDVIDAEIESLRGDLAKPDSEAEPEAGSEPVDVAYDAAGASRLRLLEKTRSLLGQEIDELRRAETLDQATADLDALAASGVASLVDHEPPFGFDDLDSVLSRLDASRAREVLLEDTVAAGVEVLDDAESRLRLAQQARSQARERLESGESSGRAAAEANLEQQRLAARLAEAELEQLRLQLTNDRRELELVERREEILSRGASWVRSRVRPTAERLDERLAALVAEQDELRGELADLRRQAEREESRLLREQSSGGSGEVEATRTALDLLDRRQRLLEERIDRRDLRSELWRQRHRLASGDPDRAERVEIQSAVSRDIAELERDQRLLRARLQNLRTAEASISEQLQESPDADAASASLLRQGELLDGQAHYLEDQIDDIEAALGLARRVESEATVEGLDAAEVVAGAWSRVVSVWRWQITEVDSRSITLGMVILALLLLIAGYMASKRISQSFGRVLQQRFGLSGGAAAALQSIAFYLMVIAFVLWAMQLVSIPLTVFTLLGGVLAIGIGFGSQNVVNNFISGLILLVERPVKVGDLVEVDGTVGSVERIGLRSARVRSGDNTHIIVPNSTFLEQKVLNWTVTDDLVRTQVDVGIAYGSPTRKAEKLMMQALEEEPRIVQNMPKEVHFVEFGDNALHFRAYFWLRVKVPLDKQRLGSALRFRIDELFADAGIVIAFPQRDVHLDTLSPLQVRLLDRPAEKAEDD